MKKILCILIFVFMSAKNSYGNELRCGGEIMKAGMTVEEVTKECPSLVHEGISKRITMGKCRSGKRFVIKTEEQRKYMHTLSEMSEEEKAEAPSLEEYTDTVIEQMLEECREKITTEYDLYIYKKRGRFIRYLYFNLEGILMFIGTSDERY